MNTFSLVLLIAVIVTGLAYAYDYFKLRPARLEAYRKALAENPKLPKKEARRLREGDGFLTQLGSFFPLVLVVFLFRAFIFEPFRIPSGSMEPTLLPGDFIAVSKWSYGIRNPLTNDVWIETGKPERGDVVVFKYPEDPRIDYIKRVVGVPGDEIIFAGKRIYLRKACVPLENVHPDFINADSNEGNLQRKCTELKAIPLTLVGEVTAQGPVREEKYQIFDEVLGEVTHKMQINLNIPDLSQYYFRQKGALRSSWLVPEGYYFVMGDNRDNSKDSRFWGFVPEENLVGKTVGIWMSLEFDRAPSSSLPSFIPSAVRFDRMGGID